MRIEIGAKEKRIENIKTKIKEAEKVLGLLNSELKPLEEELSEMQKCIGTAN